MSIPLTPAPEPKPKPEPPPAPDSNPARPPDPPPTNPIPPETPDRDRPAELDLVDPSADLPSPPGTGLSEDELPDLPPRRHDRFRGRRFIPVDPPDLLNREGTEVVLIGADEDVFEELGVQLNPERETVETAELFNDLRMERTDHPLKPLFEGRWA